MVLGFETEGEMNADFIISASRAQRMIFSDLSDEVIARITLPDAEAGESYKTVDLEAVITDLERVTAAPENALGEPLRGARIIGTTLIVRSDSEGEALIRYKRVPKDLTNASLTEKIDLPRRAEYLLPILTAAYFWLDDDEEKAAYYISVYKTEAARLKSYGTPPSAVYHDTTGWA